MVLKDLLWKSSNSLPFSVLQGKRNPSRYIGEQIFQILVDANRNSPIHGDLFCNGLFNLEIF